MVPIRRHPVLILLAAFAALVVLSACDSSPISSPASPDAGMSAAAPSSGTLVANDHGGGNGNGGGNNGNSGHNNNGNDNDDNDNDDNGNDDHGGNGHDGNGQMSCPAAGRSVEVEGTVSFRGATSVLVHQQGHKDSVCLVNRATRIRKGNTTYTLAQIQTGWRVHVKGTSQANSISSVTCSVAAREIKVQNTHQH